MKSNATFSLINTTSNQTQPSETKMFSKRSQALFICLANLEQKGPSSIYTERAVSSVPTASESEL